MHDQKKVLLLRSLCPTTHLSPSMCQDRVQCSSIRTTQSAVCIGLQSRQLSISGGSSPTLSCIGEALCLHRIWVDLSLFLFLKQYETSTAIALGGIRSLEVIYCFLEAVQHTCKNNTISHRKSLHISVLGQLSLPLSAEWWRGLLLGFQCTLEHRWSGRGKLLVGLPLPGVAIWEMYLRCGSTKLQVLWRKCNKKPWRDSR